MILGVQFKSQFILPKRFSFCRKKLRLPRLSITWKKSIKFIDQPAYWHYFESISSIIYDDDNGLTLSFCKYSFYAFLAKWIPFNESKIFIFSLIKINSLLEMIASPKTLIEEMVLIKNLRNAYKLRYKEIGVGRIVGLFLFLSFFTVLPWMLKKIWPFLFSHYSSILWII